MKGFLKLGVLVAATLAAGYGFATELETEEQKLGYLIGMDIGASLKEQGAAIDIDSLLEAIRATYTGEATAMTPEEAAAMKEQYIAERQAEAQQAQAAVASSNAAEGDAFMLENRNKEGVEMTDSGLQYKVLTMGEGPKPAASDRVTVHYRGTLLNGQEFDSSYSRNEPATFQLNQVIPGWTEGLQLMPQGSKFMFYIPSNLAYGANGPPSIGPNATLIFEVELLGVE
jgi:FKBP-type peptidyl-prolyl cis-trans isomerase